MTAMMARLGADPDSSWRAEFRALVLEIDRRAVALDVRSWPRPPANGALSVLEHLQVLHQRWRVVPVVAPAAFVPEPAPAVAPSTTVALSRISVSNSRSRAVSALGTVIFARA